jgi:hypothetical protein
MLRQTWDSVWGAPCSTDLDVLAVGELIRRVYEDLGEPTGGPLHTILDDDNIDDEHIESYLADADRYAYLWDGRFERWAQAGDDVSAEHRMILQITCEAILRAFREFPETLRAAAMGWAFGHVAQHVPEVAARVATPEMRAAVADRAGEMFANASGDPLVLKRDTTTVKACAPIPCLPFRDMTLHGAMTGIINPGPGMVFAPDAQITGPFESVHVNPDGSATVTGMPLVGNAPEGSPLFGWSSTVTMHPDGSVETSTWTAEDVLRASGVGFHASVADALAVPPAPRYVGDDADREG